MKVERLVEELALTVFHPGALETEITGAYCGDLLSWVMGKSQPGQIWCTIMSNQNVAAVAALNDLAAVLLTEGVTPDEGLLAKAKAQNITLLGTPMPTYSAAFFLHNALDLPMFDPNDLNLPAADQLRAPKRSSAGSKGKPAGGK